MEKNGEGEFAFFTCQICHFAIALLPTDLESYKHNPTTKHSIGNIYYIDLQQDIIQIRLSMQKSLRAFRRKSFKLHQDSNFILNAEIYFGVNPWSERPEGKTRR